MKATRFLQVSFAACLAAMFLSVVADAQPPQDGGGQEGRQRRQRGGFGGGFGGPGFGGPRLIGRADLLGSEDVLDELNVDDGQAVTLKAAVEAYREERSSARPDFSSMRDMSPEERQAFFQKMNSDREALAKKSDDILGALLNGDQAERLDQIKLQVNLRLGLTATLKSEELRSKLSIKDEQIAKLDEIEKEIQEKRMEEFRAAFQARRGERPQGDGERGDRQRGERPQLTEAERAEANAAREKARLETESRFLAVLTDEQQKTLDGLKGKPFTMDMRALIGRGGRGGGGGGGDRGDGGRGQGDRGGNQRQRQRPAADSNDPV